ncbi:protein phosphatase 2C domain-containing protein [Streptomyces sp. ME01-24h]|nr:protein phosphatase 2C domain-containing protein [Streptomyces sp. ME01-24h]
MPHETVCPECSEPLEPDDKFCGVCGADLSAPRRPDAYELAPPDPAGAPEPPGGEPPSCEPAPPARDTDTLPFGLGAADLPRARIADPRLDPAAGRPSPARPRCVACGLGEVDPDGYCEHCGHAQPRPRDHQEQECEGVAAVTDRGLRHHRNEDAFALATTALPDGTPAVVAVVCDGVSSAYRPDDASETAAHTARTSLVESLARGVRPADAMRDALLVAAQAVTDLAAETPEEEARRHHNAPACTCVSAITYGRTFTVGWIGDSRAYWIPDDRSAPASRLTEDDSWAERMVVMGLMTQEEAYADERAHAITGWLGADAVELDPHTASFEPDEPGVVVVCTDGLWNYAESAAELSSVVPEDAHTRPLHCARTLLGVAIDGGGHDNITVAVLPFPAP